ncbi:hypothetical protein [Deinococcus sedimenti]|uniref:Uncharacterized protein n=1 Tax=Deinococcus sedimenti TaxID=1867090 RepID=A0ABQ2RYA9_9DEIO|nr:hypothetical protein [Deinococcus sedimenti]GGR80332.1 hypothetical protein GCM10008960_04040 [Deinococcus sedimenti]
MPLRLTLRAALLGTLLAAPALSAAQATSVNFGVAYVRPADPWTWPAWAQLGVDDVSLGGGTLSASVSTRTLSVGYRQGLSLPPLATVTARTDLTVTVNREFRVSSRASGSAGPVAVTAGGAYFTLPATGSDPLAAYAEAPADLRLRGWTADLSVRYRVNRDLVAVLGGEFGPQQHAALGVEGRRALTRVLPPDPADVPGDSGDGSDPAPMPEPETEVTGTVTWRAGVRGGPDLLAVTGGVGYATPAGVTLNLDALAGVTDWRSRPNTASAHMTWGLTGSVGAPDLLGEGSTLRAYAAYEPWRAVSSPLRAGVNATVPAGPGTLNLDLAGGRGLDGTMGFGVRMGYRLDLSRP